MPDHLGSEKSLSDGSNGPCDGCGCPDNEGLGGTYWFADNELWNEVTPSDRNVMLCPHCFTKLCEESGKGIGWRAGRVGEIETLAAQRVGEPAGEAERLRKRVAVAEMEREWMLGAWAAMSGIPQAQAEAEMLAATEKWRALAAARLDPDKEGEGR